MGDYSLICAVTGLPITNHQKVVAFETEPARYEDGKNRFIPASWPVFGEYDMGGGVEGHDLTPDVALVHLAVWENAEMYWHEENNHFGWNFLEIERAKEKAKKNMEYARDDKDWTDSDYLFYALRDQFTHTDEGLVFRELLWGKKDALPHPDNLSFLYRSKFMEIILQRILSGEWNHEQDMRVVHKLVCLYSGQMMTGKYIAPSLNPMVEQYPKYQQRIRIMRKHLELARQLRKEQEAR